jgi:peptidoglycan hydrolase-like protein with peptidoglycan-binding domain
MTRKIVSAVAAVLMASGLVVTAATASNAAAAVRCTTVRVLSAGTQYAAVVPATSSGSLDCYLQSGHTGRPVAALQRSMEYCNYQSVGLKDGIYGAKTKSAVTSFQSTFGLVPDGIYGVNTRKKMWFWSSESDGWGFCN